MAHTLRDNLSEWQKTPFESQQHMVAAMSGENTWQYRNVESYRLAVETKIGLGTSGIEPIVRDDHARVIVGAGIIGAGQTTAGRKEAATILTTEQEYAAIRGPGSVRPAARAKSQAELIAARERAKEARSHDEFTRVNVRPHDIEETIG